MRFQEIYNICKKADAMWQPLTFEEVKSGINTYYKVQNPDSIRATLAQLDAIEAFAVNLAAIRNISTALILAVGDIIVDHRGRNELSAEYIRLRNKVTTINELFDSVQYRQDGDGFDIKLPPNMSLSELSKCAKDMDILFSTCPLFSNNSVSIIFSAVDVGSVWLSFVIGGAVVAVTLRILAELVDKALIIRSHYFTTQEQEEKIRALKLGNDLLDNAVEINKTISKGLLEQVCTDLAEEHGVTDPEDKLRLKNSLQLLSEWMCKGMEIHPSVLAQEEIKAVFPPIEKQTLPQSMIALLTDGSNSKEE